MKYSTILGLTIIGALALGYFTISMTVLRFRQPTLTETQIILCTPEGLMWERCEP